MTYVAVLVRLRLRARDVGVVDSVWAAVFERPLEEREAIFGRIRISALLYVQDNVRVSRLVGRIADLKLLAGEWGRGDDGGGGEDEDR